LAFAWRPIGFTTVSIVLTLVVKHAMPEFWHFTKSDCGGQITKCDGGQITKCDGGHITKCDGGQITKCDGGQITK
jgi:hypothetical protein